LLGWGRRRRGWRWADELDRGGETVDEFFFAFGFEDRQFYAVEGWLASAAPVAARVSVEPEMLSDPLPSPPALVAHLTAGGFV